MESISWKTENPFNHYHKARRDVGFLYAGLSRMSHYKIKIYGSRPDFFESQSNQRNILFENGCKDIKWLSGFSHPKHPNERDFHCWRFTTAGEETLLILKLKIICSITPIDKS
jgi:hypothetical protein